jgi:transcriptional regulator with XRE-family HTH domain
VIVKIEDLPRLLKKTRLERGLTQSETAKQIGKFGSASFLSYLENEGRNLTSYELVDAVAHWIGVTVIVTLGEPIEDAIIKYYEQELKSCLVKLEQYQTILETIKNTIQELDNEILR